MRQILTACTLGAALVLSACGSPTTPTRTVISITCPTVPATESPTGIPVAVSFAQPSLLNGTAPVTSSCAPQSGSLFPLGDTTVTCQSADAAAHSASCTFLVTVRVPPRLLYTQFLAFGDSITEGKVSDPVGTSTIFAQSLLLLDLKTRLAVLESALTTPHESYPAGVQRRLSEYYRQQTFTVVNAGLGGEYVSLGEFPGVLRFPGVVASANPQVVFLMEGTNDLLTPSGFEPALAALDSMIMQALSQGRQVCLATIPPQRPNGLANRAAVAARIPGFNDRIRALAASRHVVLVDVYNALKDDLRDFIGIDDLHPTEQGYQVIASTFFDAVRSAFEQGGGGPVPRSVW